MPVVCFVKAMKPSWSAILLLSLDSTPRLKVGCARWHVCWEFLGQVKMIRIPITDTVSVSLPWSLSWCGKVNSIWRAFFRGWASHLITRFIRWVPPFAFQALSGLGEVEGGGGSESKQKSCPCVAYILVGRSCNANKTMEMQSSGHSHSHLGCP